MNAPAIHVYTEERARTRSVATHAHVTVHGKGFIVTQVSTVHPITCTLSLIVLRFVKFL